MTSNSNVVRMHSTKQFRGRVRGDAEFVTPAYVVGDEAGYAFTRKVVRRNRMEISRRKMLASRSR